MRNLYLAGLVLAASVACYACGDPDNDKGGSAGVPLLFRVNLGEAPPPLRDRNRGCAGWLGPHPCAAR